MNKEEIKKLRESLHMNMQQLADKLGVSRFTVYRWESGKSKPHSVFVKMMDNLKKKADK